MGAEYVTEIKESSQNQSGRKPEKKLWNRDKVFDHIINFEEAKSQKQSQRQFCKENNVARSTLQDWLKWKSSLKGSTKWIDFFTSSEGLSFLHLLIVAAHMAFTKEGTASLRNICRFLELCWLDQFVGSSYGSQQKISSEIDKLLNEFGHIEGERLAKQMKHKEIALGCDEMFPERKPLLVAIEPVSNFILAEKITENREGKTWYDTIQEGIKGLKVKINSVTSDEGSGLVCCIKKMLNVHHFSDEFHVVYEIVKGCSGAMASAIKSAEKSVEIANSAVAKVMYKRDQFRLLFDERKTPRPNFERQIEEAEIRLQAEQGKLELYQKNQENLKDEILKIGESYHPYDLETGAIQEASMVESKLEKHFKNINEFTQHLSEKCKKHIEKAYRVKDNLVSSITFYFSMIITFLNNSGIPTEEHWVMQNYLIPARYMKIAASKLDSKHKEKKSKILKKAEELEASALILLQNQSLTEEAIKKRIKVATECAQVFQRTSSFIEGRNGQISLRKHTLHSITETKLKAMTVIHNYFMRNKDGTTPAERFFDAQQTDLFAWILDRIDLPVRPREAKLKVA